jgi:hypothetical protein
VQHYLTKNLKQMRVLIREADNTVYVFLNGKPLCKYENCTMAEWKEENELSIIFNPPGSDAFYGEMAGTTVCEYKLDMCEFETGTTPLPNKSKFHVY